MISGVVTKEREPIMTLEVRGPNGQVLTVDFVLDTGFSGYMTLTEAEVVSLELKSAAASKYRFANSNEETLPTYTAYTTWDEQPLKILIVQLKESRLIGMSLLSGSTLSLEATADGNVTIDADTVDPFR